MDLFLQNLNHIRYEFEQFNLKNLPHNDAIKWLTESYDNSIDAKNYSKYFIPDPAVLDTSDVAKAYWAGIQHNKWYLIPIFADGHLNYTLDFPITHNLIKNIDKLRMAGFMILTAGSFVPSHKHVIQSNITHYNLYDLKNGSSLFILSSNQYDDEYITEIKKANEFITFNTGVFHKTINNSQSNRVSFVIETYV